jgi:hypothetical protein
MHVAVVRELDQWKATTRSVSRGELYLATPSPQRPGVVCKGFGRTGGSMRGISGGQEDESIEGKIEGRERKVRGPWSGR